MNHTEDRSVTQAIVIQDIPDSPSVRLTVKTSAYRYLEGLRSEDAVYFLWGVDGADSSSRWVAFAFSERQYQISSKDPFVTQMCGVKVVVPEAQRIADLDGRTLTCQQGRLLVT
jgi:hypothetical protein